MNSKIDISNWERHCSLVENLRDVELPPVWLPAGRQRSRAEQGNFLFESGRQRVMASHAISLLERAEHVAVISSFLLADQAIEDAIVEAAGRGVRVYILLASEARLGREAGDGEFERKVLEQHKAMLNRLAGHALFRSASHFHAKVVLADPFDDLEPQGMLLTANLTTEALERNEELGVQLLPDEVLEMASYLRWAMWESAEHEMVDPKDRFKAVKALGEVKHPAATTAVVATTAGSNTLRQEILRLICEAREQIIVSSFGWDAEHEVVKLLCARAQAGLQVIVLARVRPAAMPALIALAKAGAVVYAFNWLHAKAIWTDRRQGLLMSANL
ncbi:MAG TPA: phosphatidylserine/phosphatidylglycerophosphate/cardiolipin synthase family protein, partial [Pseudomonas sp.]|nr:phosphatidylserine/phosphatidylglycerophosphate/cardiolipin synthase family protein [Pseudomonas sp.]